VITACSIVPIRSAETIAEKLEILRSDRARIKEMGEKAAARAATFTWENYERRLAESVAKACQTASGKA